MPISVQLRTFPVIVSNNYRRISGKMNFTIEDKAVKIHNIGLCGRALYSL
jgi:hypothetical protein